MTATERRRWPSPPAADEDILVWDLWLPAGAIGVVAALADGYEGAVQLRAIEDGAPGDYMAWVAPAFAGEIKDLLSYVAARFGVAVAGPRPFGPADLAAGIHLPARFNNGPNAHPSP